MSIKFKFPIPKATDLILKAKEASVKGKLGALRSTLAIYYADNEGFYYRANHPYFAFLDSSISPWATAHFYHLVPKYIQGIPHIEIPRHHIAKAIGPNPPFVGSIATANIQDVMADSGDTSAELPPGYHAARYYYPTFPPGVNSPAQVAINCTQTDMGGRVWSTW